MSEDGETDRRPAGRDPLLMASLQQFAIAARLDLTPAEKAELAKARAPS